MRTSFERTEANRLHEPAVERRLISVPETAKTLGLGATGTWALIRDGRLNVVRIGRRTLVPIEEVNRFLNNLQQEGAR